MAVKLTVEVPVVVIVLEGLDALPSVKALFETLLVEKPVAGEPVERYLIMQTPFLSPAAVPVKVLRGVITRSCFTPVQASAVGDRAEAPPSVYLVFVSHGDLYVMEVVIV